MTKPLPLCVDLDGTLIRTDVLQESILAYIWKKPWKFPMILFWFIQGRAKLKEKLAACQNIRPETLPFNTEFLAFLKRQKESGRPLILVTASDTKPAHEIARYVGIFEKVLASDGITNLRADAKADALVKLYGEKGFAYAGNSCDDLKVWAKSGEIIAVNAPKNILDKARLMGLPVTVFQEGLAFWRTLHLLGRPEALLCPLPLSGVLFLFPHYRTVLVGILSMVLINLGSSLLASCLKMRAIINTPLNQKHLESLQTGAVQIPFVLYMSLGLFLMGIGVILTIPYQGRIPILCGAMIFLAIELWPTNNPYVRFAAYIVMECILLSGGMAFL